MLTDHVFKLCGKGMCRSMDITKIDIIFNKVMSVRIKRGQILLMYNEENFIYIKENPEK
jgi:hypothetical protein